MVTIWKFDRESGRIVPEESFAMEMPPYWQDLCDAGKKVSEGWIFCNSFNTEMATGGIEKGNPPFEAGVSQRDMDYLHVINLAQEVLQAEFDNVAPQTRCEPKQSARHAIQLTGAVSACTICGSLCISRPGEQIQS